MDYALEVSNITKTFGRKKFYALRNVSFKIKQGEVFGLLGPNGAGKTTLMNVITNIIIPDKGEVNILGQGQDIAVFREINGVSGDTYFHWGLTGNDILKFYGMAYGLKGKLLKERIKEMVDIFEIKDIMNKKFTWLSTGERMRLAFAKALINRPKLLLLDEPTLGLDPDIAVKVRKTIREINKKFKTSVLLTSHYMQEVELLCNRIGFINSGKIVDIGTVESVKVKHFNTYDVGIKVKKVKNKLKLKKAGFRIKNNNIYTTLSIEDDLSTTLATIHKFGLEILDIKVRKPSLEDYFIKLKGKIDET
ncbi:ABC transporter ATP-binding protein [Nanoarchaeota archaeon]